MEKEELVQIFISFSFADEIFAKELSKFLKKICQNEKIVYCVAENNNYNAVKYGQDFSEDFVRKVKECKLFIPLLSLNYLSSVSSIIELGVALGTDKTILPILLPGVRYQDFDKLYNLRNKECYNIDNKLKFIKFVEIIREHFKITNWNESDISNFYFTVSQAKEKYLPYISRESKCRLSCKEFSDKQVAEKFCKEIIQEKLVETIICKKIKNTVVEYHLYMWPGKTIVELQSYLDKNGFDNYIINRLD